MNYKYGPEIEPEITAWLRNGASFPEYLELTVTSSGKEVRRYRILDRDQNGVVSPLKSGRKGRKGFVLRVQDPQTNRHYAAKLCIPSDYEASTPLDEIELATVLQDAGDLFLVPMLVGSVQRFAGEPGIADTRPWICFLSDWLEGITLEEFVARDSAAVDPALMATIAKDLITAILFLDESGLKHDDLNLGNLMIVEGSARMAKINPEKGRRTLRVIDMGSVKRKGKLTFKQDDDWSSSARCLTILYNCIHRNRAVASQHPEFLALMYEFIAALSDENQSRHFPETSDYVGKIQEAEDTLTIEPTVKPAFHPLDAISAEHLASDELLLRLFVDHVPWIAMVEEPGPVALLGPRGCGKSMVFRYLALRTHISSKTVSRAVLENTRMFGVYIGCASELGNDLVWIGKEGDLSSDNAEAITDYFNIVLARELMRTLASAAKAGDISAALGIKSSSSKRILEFLSESFTEQLNIIQVGGMEPFQACADAIDRLRLRVSRSMRERAPIKLHTGSTFARDLCRTLVQNIPGLSRYPINFLLDDYTIHRLSKPVQEVMNAVVFQRDASHVFKISSEPYGFDATNFYGARVDANREFYDIDAGDMTLAMNSKERRVFVTSLLDKRLDAANYIGRAGVLIGNSEHDDDVKLANHIRSSRTGKKTYYNGLHVLSDAWSGDVATVLHMVRNMFVSHMVGKDSESRIPNHVQHDAIVRVSKGMRNRVLSLTPYGDQMSRILNAFGDLSHNMLVNHAATTKTGTTKSHRKYRIEMTLAEGVDLFAELRRLDTTGFLLEVYQELVRRAIFHERSETRGKEGAGRRTIRFQIRSSFLPSFGTSLVTENHLKIEKVEDFAEFILDPANWAKSVLRRFAPSGQLFPAYESGGEA